MPESDSYLGRDPFPEAQQHRFRTRPIDVVRVQFHEHAAIFIIINRIWIGDYC